LGHKGKPAVWNRANGFADFHQKRVREDYDRLISIYGQAIIDGDTLHIRSPHSVYLHWFAETGLPGGILFCLLFFTPLVYCLKKRTLCGEMGMILAAYAICFFFESQVHGGRSAHFSTTVIFMTLGYFSGIFGQRDGTRP
jgi:O-antigen ligase